MEIDMDAHIIQRNKGRIVKSFYRLGDFSGSQANAIDHLKSQGFNDDEAKAYLASLPKENETVC